MGQIRREFNSRSRKAPLPWRQFPFQFPFQFPWLGFLHVVSFVVSLPPSPWRGNHFGLGDARKPLTPVANKSGGFSRPE
jgi:hypothetical protein